MSMLNSYLTGLAVLCALALGAWVVSVLRRDVSIVDSVWSIFFLLAAATYIATAAEPGPRGGLLLLLVGIWSLRLAGYITWRNWGEGEDYRYQAIRARNEPHFAAKSLYLVFLLQAALAWLVSLPLLPAIRSPEAWGLLDLAGVSLVGTGIFFEAVGDFQLAMFKHDAGNRGKIMDRGLWRYTRHPNYFGDFCVWWGFYLIAASAGGWWSVPGPLLMSFLLLRVSGVALLEKDIAERRPAYAAYIRRTNAFFPGLPRTESSQPTLEEGARR